MKKYYYRFFIICALNLIVANFASANNHKKDSKKFFNIEGQNIIAPNGKNFQIKGTNLGNWLNPEGYMFLF